MEIRGHIHEGVVVLDGGVALPEGTEVTVSCPALPREPSPTARKRVAFPLVRSKHPGSVHLTNERIAEVLDQEDAAPGH